MNREVHVRFWEQPEVQSLRLTRLNLLPAGKRGITPFEEACADIEATR